MNDVFPSLFPAEYKEGSKKPDKNQKPTISDSKKAEGIVCDFGMEPGEGQFCKVDASELLTDACAYDGDYGFKAGTPCILIKLNRVRVLILKILLSEKLIHELILIYILNFLLVLPLLSSDCQ